jgi:carboxylate-amine ligase
MGVEEELLLVDPETGSPAAVAVNVLAHAAARSAGHPAGEIEAELQQQQIEVETTPTTSLEELGTQVIDWRRRADELGRSSNARAVALATSPLPVDPRTTFKPRYQAMVDRFRLTTMEQLTCGCHVHVGVDSDEEGVAVIDRVQPWLPILLALSANSPFYHGRDSGYASFRSQAQARFPTTGPTPAFGSAAAYRDHVERLIATEVPLDGDMIYFLARLSRHYPTVEIRVADVCARAADTIMIAGLVRSLVDTCAAAWAAGEPAPDADPDLIRLAIWRAGRSAVSEDLLDPVSGRPRPAADVVGSLLEYVDAALTANGDRATVHREVERVLAEGTGADHQWALMKRTGDLSAVVRDAADRTLT